MFSHVRCVGNNLLEVEIMGMGRNQQNNNINAGSIYEGRKALHPGVWWPSCHRGPSGQGLPVVIFERKRERDSKKKNNKHAHLREEVRDGHTVT